MIQVKKTGEVMKRIATQGATMVVFTIGLLVFCGVTAVGDGVFDAYKDQSDKYTRPL